MRQILIHCTGSGLAFPYDAGAAQSALSVAQSILPSGIAIPSDIGNLLSDLPTAVPTGDLGALVSSILPQITGASGAEGSGAANAAADPSHTGAAAALRAPGVGGAWGVMGIWATAVVGGMAFVFVR